MPAIALYLPSCVALAWLTARLIRPMSRGAALALLLLPMLFTGRALVTGQVYGPIDLSFMAEPLRSLAASHGITSFHNGALSDLYLQMMPWRKAVRYALGQHRWPLINPFMMSGDILAAAAQPAFLHPVNLLSLLLPLPQAITYATAMTFFMASLFTFLYIREIGAGEAASLFGAAGWTFCGMMAFFVAWPVAMAWTSLPLVLLAVRRLCELPLLRNAALLCLGFVLLFLAGHPESCLHIATIGAAYGVFELFRRRKQIARATTAAIGAGVVALMLSAVYLLPFLEVLPQTKEYHDRREVFASMGYVLNRDQLRTKLLYDLFPFFDGRPWDAPSSRWWFPETARVGSLVLAAAIAALAISRRRERWFFLGLVLLALDAGSDAPPIASLFKKIPLFNITSNGYFVFSAAFGLAVLAAMTVDALGERKPARNFAVVATLLAVLLGAGTIALWASQRAAGLPANFLQSMAMAELIPLLIGVAVALWRRPLLTSALLVGLILAQRSWEEGNIYPTLPARAFYPPIPLFEPLRQEKDLFRLVGLGYTFFPDTAALYELEDPRGYEAMTNLRYSETYPLWSLYQPVNFNQVEELDRPFLSFLNVRYAVAADGAVPPGWHRVTSSQGSSLLQNDRDLGRAFVPRRVVLGTPRHDEIDAMMEESDFGRRAWIEARSAPMEIGNGPGVVTSRWHHLELHLTATMARAGWVVISQTAWKGWHCAIDGRPAPLYYANHAFLGAFVPAGLHKVTLRYRPDGVVVGGALSGATALALVVAAAVWRRRSRTIRAADEEVDGDPTS
jgi:hypothetical protein